MCIRDSPAKHEGFCTSDGAALVAEGLESGPTEKSTKAGGAAEGKDKPQGEQVPHFPVPQNSA